MIGKLILNIFNVTTDHKFQFSKDGVNKVIDVPEIFNLLIQTIMPKSAKLKLNI